MGGLGSSVVDSWVVWVIARERRFGKGRLGKPQEPMGDGNRRFEGKELRLI